MVGASYGVQSYTGRTAITDATVFIESLGANTLVDLECWAEAENTRVMIVYTVSL
jgi:hypothetical protein